MITSIIVFVLVLVFGSLMVYFARLQGHTQFLMAIGSFIFIMYLVVRDIIEKIRAKRAAEREKDPKKKAAAKKKDKTGNISGIAHRSTKDKK